MSSRNMCLLPRATLHSDSEQYMYYCLLKAFTLPNFHQTLLRSGKWLYATFKRVLCKSEKGIN
jgi:hypothetical protein